MRVEPGEDMLDLRDIAEEYERLKDEDPAELAETGEDEILAAMRELEDQICGTPGDIAAYSDNAGPEMILDTYFEEYARQLADDIGAVQGEGWPNYCIDWEWAARELRQDYSSVTYGGYSYWVRG